MRRGKAAQTRVECGQVSKARQELIGASLAPKTAETLRELQEKRPQVRVREIPHEVSTFTQERPLDFDVEMFSKCLSAFRVRFGPRRLH